MKFMTFKNLTSIPLPPYSPQMNRIEDEWLHLKRDQLASRVFEDDYEKRARHY